MDLTGLILAGGESKRAGTDKGLKLLGEETWVAVMRKKLKGLNLDSFVSVNQSQVNSYREIIQEAELIVDDAKIPGPLRGILTAHSTFPDLDWMILACDLVDMKPEVIGYLAGCFEQQNNHDFYVYQNHKFYQPFCGIYTAKGLAKLLKTYKNSNEHNYSMQHVFESFDTFAIPVSDTNKSFKNYNK